MIRIAVVDNTQEVVLHGEGLVAGVLGARPVTPIRNGLEAGAGTQRVALEISLAGLPAALRDWQDHLTAMLGAGDGLRLRVQPHAGAEVLETRVLEGVIEHAGAGSIDRARGSLALRLELVCAEGWEGETVELALSNAGGSTVTGGLALFNHINPAAGKDNFVDIAADSLAGDLPGSIRLELANSAAQNVADVWLCQRTGEPGAFRHILEGEGGSGGSQVAQGDCSGGALRRVTAGTQPGTLITWTLDAQTLAGWAGRALLPLARFAAAPAYTNLWLWWQLSSNGAVLWSGPRELLQSGAAMQTLPGVVYLPEVGEPAQPLTLALCGMGASGGYSLDLDFVQFCPLDGLRRYRMATPLAPGWTLVDDGFTRQVSAQGSHGSAPTLAAEGVAIRLAPGQPARLICLHGGAIESVLTARIFYRPRWAQP